jgi:cell division transport system permease protein
VLDSYKTRVSVISVAVADQTPLATVYDFKQQLEADPRVTKVVFVTKEEELNRFSADPRNRDLIANIEGNPVPAKLEVHVKDLRDVDAINNLGRSWRGADRSDPTDYQGDFIARMVKLSAWLSLAGYALMAILVVVSVVIVMNTIRTAVYHRRQEIEVMKLVGATEWFVRGPFVIEGVMTGVLAASLALGLLLGIYRPFVERFRADLFFIPLSYDPHFVGTLGQDLFLGGALLGAMGSYIGVRRYVRI